MEVPTMNILKRRSASHSIISTVFTVIVVAVVVLLNVAITILSSRVQLEIDLTSTQIYSLSDAAKENLKQVDTDITITFCQDQDFLMQDQAMDYVVNTVLDLARENKHIHVRFINSVLEPQMFKGYVNTNMGTSSTIRQTDIIIEKGNASLRAEDESVPEFRKLSANACFVTDPNTGLTWAYNGEETIIAACLAVTVDNAPKAYFTLGHGEAATAEFINVITNAGYEPATIDLTKEDIPVDCRLLIINDPRFDFAGYSISNPDAVSEIEKIDRFLEGNHTLMVFKNPEVTGLTNLDEFLYEWGITFGEGVVTDLANSLTADGATVVAQYPSGTLASSVHKEISSLSNPPKTIVKYASPIYVPNDIYVKGLDENSNPTNTYTYSGNNAYRELSAVLVSSSGATEKNKNGEVINTDGGYNLMTITRELNVKDNDEYYSYVLAAGTTQFADSEYITSNTYANENILYYALRVMGRKKVPANIDFKIFKSDELGIHTSKYSDEIEGMTWGEKLIVTIPLCTVVPILMLLCGTVVIVRRKYR